MSSFFLATVASTSKSEVEPKQAEAIYSPHDLAITTELEQGKTILEAVWMSKSFFDWMPFNVPCEIKTILAVLITNANFM